MNLNPRENVAVRFCLFLRGLKVLKDFRKAVKQVDTLSNIFVW